MPETPKFLLAMNRKEDALEILSRMYAINSGEPKEVILMKSFVVINNEILSTYYAKSRHSYEKKKYI